MQEIECVRVGVVDAIASGRLENRNVIKKWAQIGVTGVLYVSAHIHH